MAKHDVFISYSRKDKTQVQALIDLLSSEIPKINIWYDMDGIEAAADFQTKIINAIDGSNFIIFVCSNNSLDSEYCRKEIMYAKNKKKNVIPYLLQDMKLDGWLLFEFGTINCISSTKGEEVSRMINDLKQWCASGGTLTPPPENVDNDDNTNGELDHKKEHNETTEEDISIIPFDTHDEEISPELEKPTEEEIEISLPWQTSEESIVPDENGEETVEVEIPIQPSNEEELQFPEVKEDEVNVPEKDVTLIPLEDNANNLEGEEVELIECQIEEKPSEDPTEAIDEPTQPSSEHLQSDNHAAEHEWVDMGLPSGVKWATCNIGAERPEEYGEFFAWGEVKSKTSFKDKNIITANKSYETLLLEGIIDESGNLTPGYDAATQNWGEPWRLPTDEELEELRINIKAEWTTINGVKGKLFTSKINGNTIFFPASGFYSGDDYYCKGLQGIWWSATAKSKSKKKSHRMVVMKPYNNVESGPRYEGYPVRPVLN